MGRELSHNDLGVTPQKARDVYERLARLGVAEDDLDEKFVTGSGPGGQKVNRTANVVQLLHVASGRRVTSSQGRSRALNRFLARRRLAELLEQERMGPDSPDAKRQAKARKQKDRRRRRATTTEEQEAPPAEAPPAEEPPLRAGPEPDMWRMVENRILGEPRLNRMELSEITGVDPDDARDLWKALGFAPVDDEDRMFTDADLEALQRLRDFRNLGIARPEITIQLARVLGQAAYRVAEAQAHAVDNPIPDLLAGVAPEMAKDTVDFVADYVVPGFIDFVTYAWKRHLVAAVRREVLSGVGTERLVGFADLVGFTSLTLEMEDESLASLIGRFEDAAYDCITERGGRPVKIIGDEIMFVADDVRAGADIALDLVELFAARPDLPDLRIGLAAGPTVQIEGDLYGQNVNLASRLAVVARPGTILVSEKVAETLQDDAPFRVRQLRTRHLKGMGDVRLWTLRRAQASPPDRA
ncbi:MAG: hypothetical protein DYH08_06500 [Actinobacteria bacterium ATB1]|nr:hypothetical protein [Actinobacteria bacterium ATB1]